MIVNKEFRFTFQPKDPGLYEGKKRFSVGAHSLHKYIGQKNAASVLATAMESTGDKVRIKFRKMGWVDVYAK